MSIAEDLAVLASAIEGMPDGAAWCGCGGCQRRKTEKEAAREALSRVRKFAETAPMPPESS